MRVFLTGGTGFLGLNLMEKLDDRPWEVTALHRTSSAIEQLKTYSPKLVEGDITSLSSLREACPEDVDVIFHMAADTSTWYQKRQQQWEVNVEGTRNVVEVAMEKSVDRLIYTSTWNVYGIWRHTISEEMRQEGDQSPVHYDRSKHAAEAIVKKAGEKKGVPAIILNPSHIMGRYDQHGWASLIKKVYHEELPGIPPGAGTFCHGERVAEAHIQAVDQGRVGHNYLLGDCDASYAELIALIGSVTDRPTPGYTLPAWLLKGVSHVQNFWSAITGTRPDMTPEEAEIVTADMRIESDKAKQELAYRPSSLQAMVEDSYQWLKQSGSL